VMLMHNQLQNWMPLLKQMDGLSRPLISAHTLWQRSVCT
jgi:hypothetical protein